MPAIPNFLGGSYTAQSALVDQERTVNMYLERAEAPGATARTALYPIPGFRVSSTGTTGFGRAHFATGGREFCIIGTDFIEINQFGVRTSRGTVAIDGNPATISSTGDAGGELFITSGGNGYIFTLATNVLAAVANLAGLADMGESIDGYFLALDVSASTIYISDLLDGTTWDLTNYIQRSAAPDPWVAIKVSSKYLYFLGSQTSEVWYNAGTFPIPFQPHPSGFMNYGCTAPWSAEVVGSTVCWLGATINGTGMVMRAAGLNPEDISTYATQYAFDQMIDTADAIGDSYTDRGHTFYVLTFGDGNATWCWDEQTQVWAERGHLNELTNAYDAWRPLYHVFAFGQHRVLDAKGADVYEMSPDFYTDIDGTSGIRWVRRAPSIVNENKYIKYNTFELDMEVGLGATTGQGSEPAVMMRMSNDGGKTFGNEQWRSGGKRGEYGARVRWTRCGSARKRVYEVSGSDPIPFRLLGAWQELG